jgi:hypothetical protein
MVCIAESRRRPVSQAHEQPEHETEPHVYMLLDSRTVRNESPTPYFIAVRCVKVTNWHEYEQENQQWLTHPIKKTTVSVN